MVIRLHSVLGERGNDTSPAQRIVPGSKSAIYFAKGNDVPRREDFRVLAEHGQRLKEDRRATLVLVGHANPGDDPRAATRLALRRARSVASWLIAFGARPAQVRVESAKARAPVMPPDTAQGRALNRRVQLVEPFAEPALTGAGPRRPDLKAAVRRPKQPAKRRLPRVAAAVA